MAVQLWEARRLASYDDVPRGRLALLLLDNAAETSGCVKNFGQSLDRLFESGGGSELVLGERCGWGLVAQ